MQIFAVTRHLKGLTASRLSGYVAQAARAYPRLDGSTLLGTGCEATQICVASVSHGAEIAAPRTYRAQRGPVMVLFDGLPVDRLGAFPAHDAEVLLDRWDDLPGRLEGVFSAVRVDTEAGSAECLLDAVGLAQVYVVRRGAAWALSNSVEVLRLAMGVDRPDPLGVSSLLTLGWAAGNRTLLDGVRILDGGHLHRFADGHTTRPVLTPGTVTPRRLRPAPPVRELAEAMTRTLTSAVQGVSPVTCGLTAGRDTRILLALILASGVPTTFLTSGAPDDVDVRVAADLAKRLRLGHQVISPGGIPAGNDWRTQTFRFVSQTDGLASLWNIADWVEHQRPIERLGVKLSGAGGEIGRAGNIGIGIPLAANAPLLRTTWRPQRWVLEQKLTSWNGLLTDQSVDQTARYMREYLLRRRSEGWRPGEALESYYAFERVKHWAATSVRRAADATDVFAPFASADFIRHCYSLTPGQRYMEATHYGLLAALAPELREIPFEHPWKPQRDRAAAAHVLLEGGRWLRRRANPTSSAPRDRWAVPLAATGSYPHRWVETGLPVEAERCLSWAASPLWDFVDRRRFEELVRTTPGQRTGVGEGLSRVLTLFAYFHGRHTT